jgi:transposase-like protein
MKDRKTGERNKDNRWRCKNCGERYTVRTGTVMDHTHCPLRVWCDSFWRVCSSKKGVSALQLQRETGVSYKTPLFVMHRVRYALADLDGIRLGGEVECDKT